MIDNKLTLMTIIFTISAGLFISAIGTYADNSSVFAKKYMAQTVEEVNNCRNNALPTSPMQNGC